MRPSIPSVVLLASTFIISCNVAAAQQRIALVIGNNAYMEAPLHNPANDARDLAARLTELDFEVVSALDTDLATMQRQIIEFVSRIKPGATALFYYAGHGIQANGRNYLLPIDAGFESESSLRFEALEVADVLEELENSGSRMNLVVLDACRNNPFERRVRGGSRGLAVIDASAGSLIAYATAPGSVASDGNGDNGLYTKALLDALDKPDIKVEDVFKQVRIRVFEASNGAQVPWESSSLTADFVFNPGSRNDPSPVQLARESHDSESLYWDSINDSNDPGAFDDYIEQYPDGTFAAIANRRAAELRGPADNNCADLSGRWISRSEAANCDSDVTFTRTGPTTYNVVLIACSVPVLNKVSGTTIAEGKLLTTRWTATGCTGVTTMTLDDDCRSAKGKAVFNPSFLCKGTYKESLHYVGE